jgi:hypothetical protein
MPSMTSYNDLLSQVKSVKSPENNIPSFKDLQSQVPSKKEIPGGKAGRYAAQYGVGLAELAAMPYDIAVTESKLTGRARTEYQKELGKTLEHLATQKAFGKWTPKDEELFQDIQEQIKNPELAKQYVDQEDLSTGKLLEKGAEKLGYDLEPEDLGEHATRFLGNIVSPKNAVKGVKFGIKMLDKEFRAAHKLSSKWKSLEIAAKKNPEKEGMLAFAKDHNLTPEETTLLFKTKGEVETIGKVAKKSKKYRKTVESLHEKLGENYEQLKKLGREGGYIGQEEKKKITDELYEILDDITKTAHESPETKTAREALENTIHNFEKYDQSVEHLINTRQELRKGRNWKDFTKGSVYKEKANKALLDAIEKRNPEVAKRLQQTDKAWSKYAPHADLLDAKQPLMKVKGIQIPVNDLIWGSVLTGATGGKAAVATLGAKEAVKHLSTRLLMNPKYQGIHKRLMEAAKRGATKKQKELITSLKKMIKIDDPDLYEEIESLEVD